MRPAIVVAKQTLGEGARFHPHLHALVTSGGWDRKGVWHPLPTWDQGVLRELFEIEVFRYLRRRDLLSRERMELIRSWSHSGFGVHVGGLIVSEARASLARTVRYMLRVPVVLARLAYDRDRATVRRDSRNAHCDVRIISFITDGVIIDKILRHIGYKRADTPPPRYHPPPHRV